MKYLILISFLFSASVCFSQPITQRSSDVITVMDGNLFAKNSFRPAVYNDTTAANLVTSLDSCGKMIFTYTDNSYWLRACNPKRWIKILKTGDFATTLVNNGLSKSGDTIQLGGTLNKYTFIKIKNQKSNPDITGTNSLMLSNVSFDSSEYYWLTDNAPSTTNYDRGLIQLSKLYGVNDTLSKWYGGVISGTTRAIFSHTTNNRFKNPATPLALPYGGANMVSQLFPPDTAYWLSYPYGNTASAYSGDIGIGDTTDYYLNIIGTTAVPEYPMPVSRMGVDYARNYRYNKREMYGSGTAGYVWDWRSYQALIDAGTTEIGSYINKIYGFHAYGPLWKHDESPSKAKTLAVSTVDTSIAFYAAPVYTDFNEVKNGYGFVADGTSDYNFFKGKLKVGGTLPSSVNTQSFQLHVDSTLQVGATFSTNAFSTKYWRQNNITPTNFASKKAWGEWIQSEYSFDEPTTISDKFIRAFTSYLVIKADSFQSVSSNFNSAELNGSILGINFIKKSGYADTTIFAGSSTPEAAISGLNANIDISTPATAGTENLFTGYFSALTPSFFFHNFNKMDHAIWLNIGAGQFTGASNNVTNGYGIYINGFPSLVQNKYAIYQAGTLDTSRFAGIIAQTNNTVINSVLGKLRIGGSIPASQSFQVHIDSTLQIGRSLSTNAWHTNYWLRNNVTPANFGSSQSRGTWIQTEFSFDQNTDIRNSGITSLRADMYLHADSVQYVYNSNATGVGVMGANFGLYLRKKIGYADTTTFIGGSTATGAAAAATSRFDMSGPAASGSPNLGTGYFSSFSPNYQFNSFNTLDHAIWMNIGVGQFIGTTNATNGYGVYINGFPSQVTNKYAIYQSGTLDSNLFYGKVRLPNVLTQTDTTLYKPAVFDALGNIHKLTSWPEGVSSVSNSDGSLTIYPTTGAVVGSINLAHSNAFTVSQSITSATQLGLQINMSNTVDNTYAVVFNRASSSVENAFNWNTNNTSEWFLGQNNDGTSDIIMFNWTANKFLYKAFISSGDIGFGNALDALYIKNDGSYVTLASLDTDNTAPATTGTTKVVVTDALGKLSFKNVTFDGSDNVTFGTTNSIVGTATNNSAVAGNIGEEVSSTISTYTNYSTTATYQNITSITLTPGDWDLTAFFTYSSNSATITAGANGIFVISTTTASAAGATEGKNIAYVPQAALLGTSLFSDAIAPYRVSISSNTTYYLNTQATFTLGNPQYVGSLRARRMR